MGKNEDFQKGERNSVYSIQRPAWIMCTSRRSTEHLCSLGELVSLCKEVTGLTKGSRSGFIAYFLELRISRSVGNSVIKRTGEKKRENCVHFRKDFVQLVGGTMSLI